VSYRNYVIATYAVFAAMLLWDYLAPKLQLSQALLAAGRPHEVLPLSGVSHMTPQPEVAENLLLLQVDFFRRNLCRP